MPAFDFAFNWRDTALYVTDPAYACHARQETYPHTYSNANGLSLNAGWSSTGGGTSNIHATNDPRIAGYFYKQNNGSLTFTIDLSSGSAPGAGTYTVDWAAGSSANIIQSNQLLDNTTVLIDMTNGGAGYDISGESEHYIDASLADIAATTTWGGTTVSKTFSSTTVNIKVAVNSLSLYSNIAHFRLTAASSGSPYTLTAATGTLSMSGQAASPRANRRLTGAKGTLALAGPTTGLRANRTFPGAKGTLTLSGADATKGLARRLTAATGSFSLAGVVSLLKFPLRRLAAATGSLTLTGRNATLRYTVPGTSTYRDRRDTTQPFRRHYS